MVKAKKQIKVQLVKSTIGRLPIHKASVKGLGLRKINQIVALEDTACIRGMINKVGYLLKIIED